MTPLGLLGTHNRRNALIARACLDALGVPRRRDAAALRAAAGGFERLGHRLQPVGTVDGVLFVDDSLSTNVLPTLAAMDAFPGRRVALIAGGHDRGIDYAPLAAGLAGRRPAPTLVLTLPDSGPRIQAAIESVLANGAGGPAPGGPAPGPDGGRRAGRAAVRRPRRGRAGRLRLGPGRTGSCCCPPAAPSFGVFRNYRERGEAFTRAMRACDAP